MRRPTAEKLSRYFFVLHATGGVRDRKRREVFAADAANLRPVTSRSETSYHNDSAMNKRELAAVAKRVSLPIGHTLRGVFLERSSAPTSFYVWVFFQPLCVPSDHTYFNLGWRLGGGTQTWNVDDSSGLDDLRESIVREAIPFLEPIKTPRDTALAGKLLDPRHDGATQRAVAYAFARAGDTPQAIREIDRFLAIGVGDERDWVLKESAEASSLKKLLLTDPAAAQRQLQEWEAKTLDGSWLTASA